MCILLQHISNPRDFVKHISGKMNLRRKELIAKKLLLHKMKKVLSSAYLCSLGQRSRNAHDLNELTLMTTLKDRSARPLKRHLTEIPT